MRTTYTFQNTTYKGNDSLFTVQASNYQPGYNLHDLIRQNEYFNNSFSHELCLLRCNSLIHFTL